LLSLGLSAFIRDFAELIQQENEQIGAELKQLNERYEGEAEPQAEHAAKIRYVLDRLYTEQVHKTFDTTRRNFCMHITVLNQWYNDNDNDN